VGEKARGDRAWVVDDDPNEQFPIWTRGNVGEVFPLVVTPLTWSLFGKQAEQGWRDAFARLGALRSKDYGDVSPAIVGSFGGYCYLNVSIHRILAVRTPGLTPDAIDRSIFGESDAPPYAPAAGDKDRMASLRMARTVATTLLAKRLPELEADKAEVAAWIARQPDPATATDEQLLRTVAEFRSLFRGLFARHIETTMRATIPVGALGDLCAKAGDPGLLLRLLGGIGDVESAAPASALWRLGRRVAADDALTAAFDGGLDGLRDRLPPGFAGELEAFQHEFGSRGPNEWEGSSATWGTDVDLVLAAVDALRRADDSHDPEQQRAKLTADREAATADARSRLNAAARRQFDLVLRSAALLSQGRERSKTTVIRALHGHRLALLELARRTREHGGPDDLADLWLVTSEELPDYIADPAALAAEQQARRARRDELAGLEPPFVFSGAVPDPSTWTSRAASSAEQAQPGAVLTGIGGCPGVARGRARVVLDPSDPCGLGPGDVLVAPITDPSWTPLFVPAEAVVVDVGAPMSHAVIVSRELGIPCVVSVTGATRSIPEGALVEVDGSAGTVRILDDDR
jgi:pyruvate,water dikinase